VENPYPFGPSGAKGAGELVFDGGAPAFALAVQEATGAEVHEIPLTPERILELGEAPA
jgi:CO/xanthine dehydrogenase Mo-binding subunit